jgi:hypothetical protein
VNAKIRNQIARRKRRIRQRLDKNNNCGCEQPVMTATNLHYEIAGRTRATNVGGIAAMHLLVKQLGLDAAIDRHLSLLKIHVGLGGEHRHHQLRRERFMSENNGSHKQADFPRTEEFIDFAGRTRKFILEQFPVPSGYGVCAAEDVEGDDGYVFRAFSSVDAFHALGDLRRRIRKLLSVRHLLERNGKLSFTHDRLRGRVAYGGVVVDGIFLTFDQLAELIQTYEGFQFDLKIVDSSDELG